MPETKGKEVLENLDFSYTPFGFDVTKYVERYEKSIKRSGSDGTTKKDEKEKE